MAPCPTLPSPRCGACYKVSGLVHTAPRPRSPSGFKLGHTIPWVEGFPFNVVNHPQYVGSVLSVWGAAALVWTQAPQGERDARGVARWGLLGALLGPHDAS